VLLGASCSQQDEKKLVKSLLVKERDGTLDTISQELLGIEFSDSIYHVKYKYWDLDEEYEHHFWLPLSNNKTIWDSNEIIFYLGEVIISNCKSYQIN
jgi:hypothetical protein